jgi:hypothetical protein
VVRGFSFPFSLSFHPQTKKRRKAKEIHSSFPLLTRNKKKEKLKITNSNFLSYLLQKGKLERKRREVNV